IVELLGDPRIDKLVHDAKTARRALRRAGADLEGVELDTVIASYLVNASRRQHLLDDLATERLGLEIPALPATDRRQQDVLPSLQCSHLKQSICRLSGSGYSTDAAVLEEPRVAHPGIDKILEYREVEKLRSTYADGLGPLIDRDGRIHTTFNQTVASTGRLS